MDQNEQGPSFCIAFDCIDGRTKEPLIEWCKKNLGVVFVDMQTKPGMDKLISDEQSMLELKVAAGISADKHGSTTALVVGHAHCAGNPVSDQEHEENIRQSCEVVAKWGVKGITQVIGLFADESPGDDASWRVTEVCRI